MYNHNIIWISPNKLLYFLDRQDGNTDWQGSIKLIIHLYDLYVGNLWMLVVEPY